MQWLKRHWAVMFSLFLTVLYIYLQLLQWKKHGDDLMLTAASMVLTCALWLFLLIAILRTRSRKTQLPSEAINLPQSKLVIHSANYAAIEGGGKIYDVTECLQQMISGDSLILDIENHNFVVGDKNFVPQDPKPGKEKRLEVTCSYDNEPQLSTERREHTRLVLPEDSEIGRLKRLIDSLKRSSPETQCDDLKELANTDAANMTSRIRQISQRIDFHFSPVSDPYLDIITELWNGSVFKLVSFGEIAGHATYAGTQLAGEPRVIVSVEPPLLNLSHGDSVSLVVRQYLSAQVADTMVANRNRGVAINFESVFVSFRILPLNGLTQMSTFRWQGPRFTVEEAKQI